MAYSDQALLSNDPDFRDRIAACASIEVDLGEIHPVTWAVNNQWTISAAPGFGDAYASAIINGIVRPGNDPSVISDGDILAAVQSLATPDRMTP